LALGDEMQGFLFGKPVPADIFEKKYLTQLTHREASGLILA
jgi:EAL domain-containing protein (putative c-di-GMP-specific phosphodiesterase class I)